RTRIGQTMPSHIDILQPIRSHQTDRWMLLGEMHHLFQTLREQPIISMHDFTILAIRAYLSQCVIVVLEHPQELRVVVNADSAVLLRVILRNLERSILAAVIHDYIFPIWICLSKDTFDTFRQIFFTVVNRSNHTDQRLNSDIHRLALWREKSKPIYSS